MPTYTGPKWLNEFESEEAFSVYDHPVVFIFQKRDDYDMQKVHDLLNSVPLTRVGNSPTYANCPNTSSYYCDPTIVNVATLSSDQAAKAPTALQFTQRCEQMQYSNGTWSDRFDEQSIVNTNQVVAVVVWWMTIMVFGFAAYPLLFVLLPGFADRGYGFAKFAGMLLTGWATWYLASLRIPVWSQVGIAGALGGAVPDRHGAAVAQARRVCRFPARTLEAAGADRIDHADRVPGVPRRAPDQS